ncbi:hypothetical protein L1987_38511 [Smallanthus sonchifolius]|uniref:Uncharacterized protein n=1 Tax=Smallanthus sonchifolius TaxID=185202 RepID=A0ACB9HKR4_9ASTR|nr:hypothetical protein L1987_38511 [Smallanthus sonchifolius]
MVCTDDLNKMKVEYTLKRFGTDECIDTFVLAVKQHPQRLPAFSPEALLVAEPERETCDGGGDVPPAGMMARETWEEKQACDDGGGGDVPVLPPTGMMARGVAIESS